MHLCCFDILSQNFHGNFNQMFLAEVESSCENYLTFVWGAPVTRTIFFSPKLSQYLLSARSKKQFRKYFDNVAIIKDGIASKTKTVGEVRVRNERYTKAFNLDFMLCLLIRKCGLTKTGHSNPFWMEFHKQTCWRNIYFHRNKVQLNFYCKVQTRFFSWCLRLYNGVTSFHIKTWFYILKDATCQHLLNAWLSNIFSAKTFF